MAAKEHLSINLVARSNLLAGSVQLTAFYSYGLDFQWIFQGTPSNVARGSLHLFCGLSKKRKDL